MSVCMYITRYSCYCTSREYCAHKRTVGFEFDANEAVLAAIW